MRFIPTRMHGLLDYLIGLLLIVWPLVAWNDVRSEAAVWVPVVIGGGVVLYSLMTAYEWGAWKAIDMSTHLVLDVMGGLVLAVSPWIFGFADVIYLPHVIIGVLEVMAGLTTRTDPSYTGRPARGI